MMAETSNTLMPTNTKPEGGKHLERTEAEMVRKLDMETPHLFEDGRKKYIAEIIEERDRYKAWVEEIFRMLGLPNGDMEALEGHILQHDAFRSELAKYRDALHHKAHAYGLFDCPSQTNLLERLRARTSMMQPHEKARVSGKLLIEATAEICRLREVAAANRNKIDELLRNQDALFEFINHEMRMNLNDPRIEQLRQIISSPAGRAR